MKEEIINILKEKQVKLCVLGTASNDAQPWSAVVGYAMKDDGTVILSTHTSSKKWTQMKENNKVSLVFGFGFDEANIQSEGVATLIESGENFTDTEEFFFSVNPHAKQFKSDDTAFVSIQLTKVRLTDYRVSPPRVEDTSFI